jgi:hypothetical protein
VVRASPFPTEAAFSTTNSAALPADYSARNNIGREKQRLQALWTAASVNLKRLFTRAEKTPRRVRDGLVGGTPLPRVAVVS